MEGKINIKKYILIIGIVIFALIIMISAKDLIFKNENITKTNTQNSDSKLTLEVNIPCPGHAGLIINELFKSGVSNVKFRYPNLFDVYFNSSINSKEDILSLEIFKEYPAKIVS